jgi:hypothetical protein
MNSWAYAVAAAAVLAAAGACVLAVRSGRRSRAELQHQLVAAREDVLALTDRLEAVAAEVVQARRIAEEQVARKELASFVITGVVAEPDGVTTPREAQLVHAIEAGTPHWVPAKPLREALVRTVALGHGVRRALSPDKRDRILLEMRAEVRRSRRQRKAEMKAVRKYLRDRRKSAA